MKLAGENKTYPCSRCEGAGRIRAFSHVVGGVCFRCGGTGKQKSKPATSTTWAILGRDPQTGEVRHIYNIRAKTPSVALKKAAVTFAGASAQYRAENSMDGAVAIPSDEYWTPERLEKLYTQTEHSR